MKGYIKLRKKAFEILQTQLSDKLFYHDIEHTRKVLKVCNEYIARDKIENHQATLLRIAAILHDIGFTEVYKDHEEKGAQIAEELMTSFNFPAKDIKIVQGLILATKIPQSPKNYLEEIICDADLDYLGRNNFYEISEKLYREWQAFSIIENRDTWNEIQIRFLEAHSYHTPFAKKNRQPRKEKRIQELKQLVRESA